MLSRQLMQWYLMLHRPLTVKHSATNICKLHSLRLL